MTNDSKNKPPEDATLAEVKPQPNKSIIEMLEELLHLANQGEIQGLAVSGAFHNAATFNCFELGGYVMALLGEHRVLERDIIDHYVDLRRVPVWE